MYLYSILANQRIGFLFTFVVIGIIVGSVSLLYGVGRHYGAAYAFNDSIRALQGGASADTVEPMVLSAYNLYQSDTYARRIAELNIARLNGLIGIQEPTDEQQTQFNNAITGGVTYANLAKDADPTEALNYGVLGTIYSILASVNIGGAHERAIEAFMQEKDLNPKNPIPLLELAVTEGRVGNYDSARSYAESAINLKPNFTEAVSYLSEIDIVTGNVEGAIASTLSVISLEPNNPARYYQLGVLETSRQNVENAIRAFERAIELDQNYANARYLLALAYDAQGRSSEALSQLERVLELNPGNADVQTLIDILKTQGSIQGAIESAAANQIVNEAASVSEENGTVTTNEAPDSPLVTPVNTPPEPRESAAPSEAPVPQPESDETGGSTE